MNEKLRARTPILTLILFVFGLGNTFAANKVVVVSLEGEIGPFAPLTAPAPPTSDYTIGTGTVLDKITGLEWQQSDKDPAVNQADAKNYCSTLDLDNKDDWRLPDVKELISIVSYGEHDQSINETVFSNTDMNGYWSTTSYDPNIGSKWLVDFKDGAVYPISNSAGQLQSVRCVRASRPKGPWLQDNDNGTVTDLATGRTWQQKDEYDFKPWTEAQAYCSDLVLGDKSDWRLPDIKELASIVDYRVSNPPIDDVMFPETNSYYWSATSDAKESEQAWQIYFYDGAVSSITTSTTYIVRCVR